MANEDLDEVFHLDENVTDDDRLRAIYEVIVHRMQIEADLLPMNTVQLLLIERIAANYIALRSKEAHGFEHDSDQRAFNSFWLSLTREFNSMLRDAEKSQKAVLFASIVDTIRSALVAEDPVLRQRVLARLSEAFAEVRL